MDHPNGDDTTSQTIASWRAAGECGDADAAGSCLAEDVVAISPLTAQFRFHGRTQVRNMLTAAFDVIGNIRYHTEIGEHSTRALFYYGRCDRERIEEAQLLRMDSAGLITELTLFARPLAGVTAVQAAIGPELLRRQGRPAMAKIIMAAARPLAVITRLGDRHLVPRADPARSRSLSRWQSTTPPIPK